MRCQRITLILIVLFSAVENAVTNIVPAPHPPQHQTKTVHPGDVLLQRQRRKVLGGGVIAPRCNLLRVDKIAFKHGVMSSGQSTISQPHPALKRYKQRVHIHTMNESMVMVSFQHWAGSADDDINLFLVGGKNCS